MKLDKWISVAEARNKLVKRNVNIFNTPTAKVGVRVRKLGQD